MIGGIPAKRARKRFTATYAATERLSVGIEINPEDDDVGPLLNWRLLDETDRRPALIVGTSSDRIGTTHGRAVYGTLSKDVEAWTGLPIAPYAGLSFGTYDDSLDVIGGLRVGWDEQWSSTHLWDGHNLHHFVERSIEGSYRVGGVLVEQGDHYYLGLSFGASL